jgi:hypothetical protein
VNKSRMVPLAEYSRDMLRALRAEAVWKHMSGLGAVAGSGPHHFLYS